ncbi:MAG: TAXI family TRAP transporter solute-binding subunit [Eubacteriales bacterium]|nr:TAXI family TRAP transporter solute-binding subunit [Eubacteriales bacterium]
MKRSDVYFVAILIVVIIFASSCNAPSSPGTTVSTSGGTSFDTSPIDISMLSGSPGGVWDMITSGISACVSISYPGSVVQITPGNSSSNISRLVSKEAEFALIHNTVAHASKSEDLRAVAALYPSVFQIVVSESLGVTTFEEIITDKIKIRLSVGTPGSSAEGTFIKLLEAYGLTVDDMSAWGCAMLTKSQTDSSAMLSDGAIDAMVLFTISPAPPVVETAVSTPLLLLEFDTEKLNVLVDQHGYGLYTMLAGTYSFQDYDIHTVSDSSYLATSADTDMETVYKVTKSIHENLNYLANVHASLKDITGGSMPLGSVYPLHPGAEMYYREIGVLD